MQEPKESILQLTDSEDRDTALLPCHRAPPPQPKSKWLTPYTVIPTWIILSSSVILYNNYLYNGLNFKYPVFLVTWHLSFASIGTRVLQRTTTLLDATKKTNIRKNALGQRILLIGFFFSGTLVCGNTAYLYLSVHYIQILKAFTPVAVLLISIAVRLQESNRKKVLIVVLISTGVAISSHGESTFNLFGFVVQAASVVFEGFRLVMIEILLHGMKMDPLVSLHYYAPVCAVMNLAVIPFHEGLAPFRELYRLGPWILLSNGALVFLLNISSVVLVGVANGLVLTLAGVLKDILLIAGSVVVFQASLSPVQLLGYSIALAGLYFFKNLDKKSL